MRAKRLPRGSLELAWRHPCAPRAPRATYRTEPAHTKGWIRTMARRHSRAPRNRSLFRPLFLEQLESRLAPAGVNVPLTTGAGVQQMPSVAADPHHPGRLAVAYLDYSLLTSGYAGVAVAVS